MFGITLLVFAFGEVSAATLVVNNSTDIFDGVCDADCSLRDAISVANNSPEDDEIVFDPEVFPAIPHDPHIITLGSNELTVVNNGSLTITGPGARVLNVAGGGSRVFTVTDLSVVSISGLTIIGGNGVSTLNTGRGGGLYNSGGIVTLTNVIVTGNTANNGGGLNNARSPSPASNDAHLTLRNCIVSFNTSSGTGGGMQNFSGSTVNIENSLFLGNTSNGSSGGGGMGVNGMVTVTNSTIIGNSAPNGPGGGLQSNGSLYILTNVTVTGNSSEGLGGGYYRATSNVNNFVRNSIFAGNTSPSAAPDVGHLGTGTIGSQGNNIVGVVGTSIGWIESDLLGVDPKLGPPGFYGGAMPDLWSVVPMNDSPAIDAGQNCVRDLSCAANNPVNALTADQRGALRDDATVDIGAFETSSTHLAQLPDGFVDTLYEQIITTQPDGFSFGIGSGTLPVGINLLDQLTGSGAHNDLGGVVTLLGTPSQAGLSMFSISITDGKGIANVGYSLNIQGSLSNVTVSGQVVDPDGVGIPHALVFISNGTTFSQARRANTFGYFSFDGVPTAKYIISTMSKGYSFDPVPIDVTENVEGVVITATSGN